MFTPRAQHPDTRTTARCFRRSTALCTSRGFVYVHVHGSPKGRGEKRQWRETSHPVARGDTLLGQVVFDSINSSSVDSVCIMIVMM